MLYQLMSVAGALMVLFAYAANQRGWMGREDRIYSLLNFVGSVLLAWVAIADQRWGFILLETAWALLSLPALIRPPARSQ